ncbi:unnamed protein product, partial [marine sediment metagenome]
FGLLSFFGLLIAVIYLLFKNKKTIFQKTAFAILVALLFISLFDHYPWTIQQGQFLFWLVLGLAATNFEQKK